MVKNRLVYTNEAAKIIRKLPAKERGRLGEKLRSLGDDPGLGKKLTAPLTDFRSLRVGKHRVIYRHIPGERLVVIFTLGHRKGIYKKARRRKKPRK